MFFVCFSQRFPTKCVHIFLCVCLQGFLKSEVSAENILFWQECEKFRKIPATSLEKVQPFKSVFLGCKSIYPGAVCLMPFNYVFT